MGMMTEIFIVENGSIIRVNRYENRARRRYGRLCKCAM
jgi:hypothetical protein